jgi:hypothetical protein
MRTLIVAIALAAVSGVASAETVMKTSQTGDVAQIYGRSGTPPQHAGSKIVTRTAQQVVPGPTTVEGPTAIAITSGHLEVNDTFGRS